ncbi:uncharacterized protein LOC129565810 [Sitodiplosis mosellana]|uniref:uncharacterized protein LOC129565810 n=1 Tax=Sitodiplosis mosellana TaxID=263140 RepID=UPI002444FBCC|nr:uncharacterized protein LOC129565810 [Sitodiplosis mosellana]
MITDENEITGQVPYQEVIGSLLYLANATRPDLSFSTSDMSRFNVKHAEAHWTGVKRILRYIKGTADYKLRFHRSGENQMLHAFCDADWGSETDGRKSRTGYVLMMSGAAISWSSKMQPIVALSSTEAEYISLSAVTREIIWTTQLAGEIGEKQEPVTIYCENNSAIQLGELEAYRPRTKHIDIRYHHIRQQIQQGVIRLEHISTNLQTADALTKAVTGDKTKFCSTGMGLSETE